jgi:hypothetical protein
MMFESGEYRFFTPIDPSKGERFVQPTCLDLEEINQLYRTTTRRRRLCQPKCIWGTQLEKNHIM